MGFTGSLILARTQVSLLDMDLLASHEAELVGRHDDHWQLAAVLGDFPDIPGLAAALVDATAAPVLIAVVGDSDTALLLADSPNGAPVDHGAQRPGRQRGPGSGRRHQGDDCDRRDRCRLGR